ncbi:MAG: tetratricopeptide repeat protein, partial [bacterium]|nr:tetratricopeptide repeat protein [bacterium]
QKNYDEAESYAAEGLAEYPESRFFLYPAAEVYKRSGELKKAAGFYEKVILSLENDKQTDRYFYLKNMLKLAEVSYELGGTETVLRLCEKIIGNGVIKDEREAVENIIDRAEDLRKSSLKRQKK